MTFHEGELNIAMMEPGTLCVPMTGTLLERRQELSVRLLVIILVNKNMSTLPGFLMLCLLLHSFGIGQLWSRDKSYPSTEYSVCQWY